jgi:hypothetical protein
MHSLERGVVNSDAPKAATGNSICHGHVWKRLLRRDECDGISVTNLSHSTRVL